MNTKTQHEFEGRSVEAAIKAGLKDLGIGRADADIEVIDKGSSGFLGLFGGKPARVAVRPKSGALPSQVRAMAGEVLRLMGMPEAKVSAQENGNSTVRLSIDSGEDNGLLIGRGGETLRALEHVMTRMAQRQAAGGRSLRVVVSVGGYKSGGNERGDRGDRAERGGERRSTGSGRSRGGRGRRRRRRKS